MRILVTNDDGINALGIRVLAQTLAKEHEVTVIAPDVERSGVSHSLTFYNTLKYGRAGFPGGIEAYHVFGTPSDCVKFGFGHILKTRPDLVVSGINRGGNLGTDIMYSGTVAAALEAVYLGVQAIAISASSYSEGNESHYKAAADYLLKDLGRLLAFKLPYGTLFNINVPPETVRGFKGVKFTPAGVQEYDDEYYPDEKEEGSYRLRGKPVHHGRNPADCDIEWIKQGYITVTPVFYDMTNYKFLAEIAKNFKVKSKR